MNVIGTRPDGWWRDRAGARRKLVQELTCLLPADEVTIVFDGRPAVGEEDHAAGVGISTRFAPGGPNAADDAIVAMVSADPAPASLVVATSDAALAERVRGAGASVLGARSFLERLGR